MKKGFWPRFFALFGVLQLMIALLVGLAGACLLGTFAGMGFPGHALGFFLGVGIVLGGISLGLD